LTRSDANEAPGQKGKSQVVAAVPNEPAD